MDIQQISTLIIAISKEIGKFRKAIGDKGKAKAKAISNYDRKVAVSMSILRNTEEYELDGKKFPTPAVSNVERIAKGMCSDECYTKEVGESDYKACLSNLTALLAQLSAMQSLYKQQDSI